MYSLKEKEKYTKLLKEILEGILFHKQNLLDEASHNAMEWKINSIYGTKANIHKLKDYLNSGKGNTGACKWSIKVVKHIKITAEVMLSNAIIVHKRRDYEQEETERLYDVFVTFINGKIFFLNFLEIMNQQPGNIYKICSCNKECYLMEEKEVLYIEANHNQVIWHCRAGKITANDSLKNMEQQMSPSFVRIQRGYLVNKNQVRHIRRCEVEMVNGDVLTIPSKKYVMVRERLFS